MTLPVFSYRDDPGVPAFPDDKPLIVFDGVCVLCSASARFVLRHDKASLFRLTAAQSPVGQGLYRHFGLSPTDYDTFLLVEDGRAWLKSDAALRVVRRMGLPWSLAALFRIVPAPLRDATYDLVARNRYRVFGRRETCFIPSAGDAQRFV